MIEQHRYHPPRKSKPRAAAGLQQTLHNHPVCARLLPSAVLKNYATAACVGFFSLWTKAK
jgi:hypothetical protein